jgi:hypothetical protein
LAAKLSSPSVAFLVLPLGGTGREAVGVFESLYQADGRPFKKCTVYADTEPGTVDGVDAKLDLGLDADQVAVIKADPAAVGPVAQTMVEHYPQFLQPESIKNGSRTLRVNTQLAVEIHLDAIITQLNRSIRETVRNAPVQSILPLFLSSTGGGAGSALVLLLGLLFANRKFRDLITEGLSPHLLDTPVAVVTEPFAYALLHKPKHAAKILANAFAFRIETALVEAQNCFQYVFHQGLANDGGTVLDRQEEIAKVLGTGAYEVCRNWSFLKARFVDTVDTNKITDRYRGMDVPEERLPHIPRPAYAAKVIPRRIYQRIQAVPLYNDAKGDTP